MSTWNANRTVHATTGQFPGLPFAKALEQLPAITEDFGKVSMAHCQLCPQSHGTLDDDTVDSLKAANPDTQFRLHANVKLDYKLGRQFDASTHTRPASGYFKEAARISNRLGADVYSLHAGQRKNAPLSAMMMAVKDLEQVFGHAVAVEGMYPEGDGKWLMDSWDEYRRVMEAGIKYALDLSHLNIVAHKSNQLDKGFVAELLAHPNCIEVHLSHNDATSDLHIPMRDMPEPWWAMLLPAANPSSVFFTEGNEMRGDRANDRIRQRMQRTNQI